MKLQQSAVGRTYRWKMRDVRITRKSPLPSGGDEVQWEAVDGGLPFSESASERVFCSEAEPLVGLDDEVLLGGVATTLRARFAAGEATTFRNRGVSLDASTSALHSATIWTRGQEPLSFPISVGDYRKLGGVMSG